MTALKTLRRDLGAHLAQGLNAAHAPLGKTPNPPAVMVGPGGSSYVVASAYCTDTISFRVVLFAPPGDLDAVADALDDMVDRVRATLRILSPAGHKYQFVEVSGMFDYDPDGKLPVVAATINFDRETP